MDLGWRIPPRPRSTGICLLGAGGQVMQLGLVTTDQDVLDLVPAEGPVWAGIDAPLLVPNREGMRRCERELLDMGVRCLPSNQVFMDRRFGGRRGEALAEQLRLRGLAPASPTRSSARAYFEVFPHGTLRSLMGSVPPYKRGKLDERRKAIHAVIDAMEAWDAPPALCERLRDEVGAGGEGLKALGDMVDAALCAVCLYAHHISQGERTQLVGEAGHGYVLLPAPRSYHEGRARAARGLPGSGKESRVQRGGG